MQKRPLCRAYYTLISFFGWHGSSPFLSVSTTSWKEQESSKSSYIRRRRNGIAEMPLADGLGGHLGFQLTLFQSKGVDYAHQITVCPPGFENLKTSLEWKKIARTRTSSELVTVVVVYSSEKKEERRKKKLFFQKLFAFCLGRLGTVRRGAAKRQRRRQRWRRRQWWMTVCQSSVDWRVSGHPSSFSPVRWIFHWLPSLAATYIYWLKFVTSMLSSFEMTPQSE